VKNLVLLLLPVILLLAISIANAQPITFTVSDPSDAGDPDLTDSTYFPPTLRSAIQNANLDNDLNLINFTQNALFIQPDSGLFIITNPLMINGKVNGNSITLDGSNIPGGSTGLYLWDPNPNNMNVGAHNSKIQNMIIVNFPGNGVRLDEVSNIEITNNLISGNGTQSGRDIDISGADIHDILIKDNFIGTDINGNIAVPNEGGGVAVLDGTDVTIRLNLISGNLIGGLSIGNNVVVATIDSNRIGTDITGSFPIGNAISGITTNGSSVLIRDNIIGGSNLSGIRLQGGSSTVVGNFIGTNPSGTDLGNGKGISITGPNNVVGGNLAQQRNIISDNSFQGIEIFSPAATGNQILNNAIGTDVTGIFNDGNGGDGIVILGGASNNTVQDNIIAFNGSNGVLVKDNTSLRNTISRNNIFLNEKLGIDLGDDGVTGNDLQDGDSGPNQKQNYPVIIFAVGDTVKGSLNSMPLMGFVVDLFANNECDLSLFGEGEEYLQNVVVNTDINGNGFFNVITARTIEPDEYITATATDPNGNTSEFSLCFPVATDLSISVTDNLDSVMVTDTITYTLCTTNKGPFNATNVVVKDTIPSQLNYISHSSTHGTSTFIGGVLECNIDTLFKDDTAYVFVEAEVVSANPILIENITFVNGEQLDFLPQNNRAIDTTRISGTTNVGENVSESELLPKEFELNQNYPNPFNPSTQIVYSLPHFGFVTLTVYDMLGREIAILVDEEKAAGNYKFKFYAEDLSSGIYYYQIKVGKQFFETKKMVLLK
jgi:uncharacterized repeat protein (TIGR01451 family)